MSTLYDTYRQMFEQIRDEKRTAANTAYRIGNAYIALLDLMKYISENISENFLHSNQDDVAEGLIRFMKGAEFGTFSEGVSGAYISKFGDAEFKELVTRALATLARLKVLGDSSFGGSLSSEEFVSGFTGGSGWAIQKKEYTNTAGETEYKYVLECDGANVRGTLRVYEFIISQLLGENDNRIFTAMQEVHHYDPSTGKVWMKTNEGKLYMPFRVNDCIMVQQFQPGNDIVNGGDGYVTKQYELVITEVGTGGATDENGERLDWVRFSDFTTPMEGGTAETLITLNDTFCRLDNLTDTDRKGIIQMISVGTNAPYMDIIYGLKTDPDEALKGRIGNLEGIQHHLFGWLYGFGAYINNAYIVGDVRLRRTGESIDTSLEILRDRLAFKMAETVYELTGDENYLSNADFTELDENSGYRSWTVTGNNARFYTVRGNAVVSSVGTLGNVASCARTELVEGRQVMHIVNAKLTQNSSEIRTPQKHKVYDAGDGTSYTDTYTQEWDRLYLSLRIRVLQEGTLSIGFPSSTMTETDAIKQKVRVLESSTEWQKLEWDGVWDGQSNFVLQFTGECYISLLSLTDKPLNDFKTEYSTQILQTTRNILFTVNKVQQNTSSIASLDITAQQINATVSQLTTDVDTLEGDVARNTADIASLDITAQQLTSSVSQLTTDVGGLQNNVSQIIQTSNALKQSVAALNTKKVAFNDATEWTKSGRGIEYNSTLKVTRYTKFYVGTIYTLTVKFYDGSGNLISSPYANGGGTDTPVSISVPAAAVTAKPSITYSRRELEPSDIGATGFMYTEDNIITQSNLSLYVEDNISWLSASANNIQFIFDKTFKIYSKDSNDALHEVMNLTPGGDLTIAGKFHGEFDDNVVVGTGSNKMYIRPNQSNGAELIGVSGSNETIKLGFVQGDSGYSAITPQLEMKYYLNGTARLRSILKPYYLSIKDLSNNNECLLMADRFSIDGSVTATSFSIESSSSIYSGVSGSFTADSKTITVKGGIITGIT